MECSSHTRYTALIKVMPTCVLNISPVYNIGGRKRAMRRGIPDVLMSLDNRVKKIDSRLLPSTRSAVEQYSAHGGTISELCSFGRDPLESSNMKKSIRHETFCSRFSFKSLFYDASNGCGSSFRNALKFLIDVTYRLAHSS